MIRFIALGAMALLSQSGPTKPKLLTAIGDYLVDYYPAAALREGGQGRVGFTVWISATGQVTGCRVTQSSGRSDLDATTCAMMMRLAQFAPARDASGNAVEGEWSSGIQWRIPADEMPVAAAAPVASAAPAPAPATVPSFASYPEGTPLRVLRNNMVICERVEHNGSAENTYGASLDVVSGALAVQRGGLIEKAGGGYAAIPSGNSGGYATLRPIARELASGITESKNYASTDGFVLSQSSSGKGPFTDGYVVTNIYGALVIPGHQREEGRFGLSIRKDGREVWRLPADDGSLAANDVDAPKVNFSKYFQNGEEHTLFAGLFTIDVSYNGRRIASYKFQGSDMAAERVRLAGERDILGARYDPARLPAGCRLEPIKK